MQAEHKISILDLRLRFVSRRRIWDRFGRQVSTWTMPACRRMSGTGMDSAVITRHLAALQLFHLLRRSERIKFLLCLLVNLPNFLLAFLLAERRV